MMESQVHIELRQTLALRLMFGCSQLLECTVFSLDRLCISVGWAPPSRFTCLSLAWNGVELRLWKHIRVSMQYTVYSPRLQLSAYFMRYLPEVQP